MTSTRGQNVSVLQLHGAESLEPPATTGRAAPVKPFKSNSDAFVNGKSFSRHSLGNCSAGARTSSLVEGYGSGRSPGAWVSSDGSSSCNVNRELSPVRWCDGDVDGVYLGKSGWVHVQQRSLDDGKATALGQRSAASTPYSPKYYSNYNSYSSSLDRREKIRPINLPLPPKRHLNPGNHKMPSAFIQESEPVAPPTVTPILSPPPAFRDEHSDRKSFYSQPAIDAAITPTLASPVAWAAKSTSSPISSSKHHSYRCSQAKSLDESALGRTLNGGGHFLSAAPSALLASRSLDGDIRETDSANVNDDLSSRVYIQSSEKKSNGNKSEKGDGEDKKDNRENCTGFRASFRDRLNAQKRVPNTCPHRKFRHNGKRTGVNDSDSAYRTRSPSPDSSNSSNGSSGSNGTNNSRSSSSSSSSNGDSSVGSRNHRQMNSRRCAKKNCQTQGKDFGGGISEHFSVKRSRSLQLSEERPQRELMLMSHSSSGKSWDQVSHESSPFHTDDEIVRHHSQSLRNLHNVMVTVNGQSIPVISSGDRSQNPLNKITTSEAEQQKLIREAEREARIISQFLNGTRSRAAARNLLIHRYFNRPEPAAVSDFGEGDFLPKPQCDPRFPRSPRTFSCAPTPSTDPDCPRETLPPQTQYQTSCPDGRRHTNAPHVKSPFSFIACPSNNPSPPQKLHPFHHYQRPPANNTDNSCPPHLTDSRSKRKHQHHQSLPQTPLLSSPEMSLSVQRQKSDATNNPGPPKFQTHPTSVNLATFFSNIALDKPVDSHRRELPPPKFPPSSLSSASAIDSPHFTTTDPHISTTAHPTLNSICLSPTSGTLPHLLQSPETKHSSTLPVDQRSLSLPRSFLSELYAPNHFTRRNSFPWRQRSLQTASEHYSEYPAGPLPPAFQPVRDSRKLNRLSSNNSSCVTLPNGSALVRPWWSQQKPMEKVKEKQLFDRTNALIFNGKTTAPRKDNASDTGSKDFRTTKQVSPANRHRSFAQDTGQTGNHVEKNSGEAPSTFSLQVVAHPFRAAAPIPLSKRDRRLTDGTFERDNCDSHDSGIHMGIRGNIDSFESQEDVDNPLPGRLHRGVKGGGGAGGGAEGTTKSVDWNVDDRRRTSASNTSSLIGLHTATAWRPLTPQESTSLDRSSKVRLRRSLSLNELLHRGKQRSSRFECFASSEDDDNPFEGDSEDELLSDSESSSASSNEREQQLHFAEAVWDHIAIEPFELPFGAGDVIQVLDTSDRHWWWGATDRNFGYFPSAFVRLRVSQADTAEDCLVAGTPVTLEASSKLRRGRNCSLLSVDQVRSSVVRELVNTEREFVKILRGVKDGYIAECNRRPDMFTSAQIGTIFSNLEDILVFQEEFLKDLEKRTDEDFPHKSCVGEAFLNHTRSPSPFMSRRHSSSGFRMYSEYCNFHPMAMAALQELYRENKYCKFFEMCRLKQNLTEIPLDGYLLTPVQRICKYPLQLAELLKYTKPDHPDFESVEKALETMRSVATLINERKRKMESLEKLAAWQQRVEGWEGDDLIELSSQLIYQGDVVRITSGMWTTNITLFLFDHQIIYCKKDLLKRNSHIYKGRICLDGSEVVDLPDGKNQQLGVTVKYGIKILNSSKKKWLVFCCRSSEDKVRWLGALAEEKRVVAQDKEVGLDLPPTAKQLAKTGALSKKMILGKARGKKKMESGHEEISGLRDGRLSNVKVKRGRKMGTWFTFGVMKSPKVSLRHRASFQQT